MSSSKDVNRILVPQDGSPLSAGILPWIVSLASKTAAEVRLFTVVRSEIEALALSEAGAVVGVAGPHMTAATTSRLFDRYDGSTGAHDGPSLTYQERPSARAAGHLDRLAAPLFKGGIKVSTQLAIGDPPTEILREAHLSECGLIAMATHGRTALSRGLLGSITDRVLHSSDLPVLVIRPKQAVEGAGGSLVSRFPTAVVVGLDGSKLSEGCLGPGADIANTLHVDLRLVRAYQQPASRRALDEPAWDYDVAARQSKFDAETYLERQAAKLRLTGISVAVHAAPGAPESVVLHLAQKWPGSLIVVGAKGRSGLSRWVLGSVTDKVVRSSTSPVLVVPPKMAALST
ncbi:MAG: universal stress protein [Chloroflexi bacterium]|nr:universal stress protein [Chloroflexota bacterium]